jgi:uncharacterized protein DUF4864
MKTLFSTTTFKVLASVVAIVLTLAFTAMPAASDDTDDAIRNIILSQIEAFANDDKEAAWSFASEGIKRQTGSVDTFYNMVRLSYEPVYKASSIEFMERVPHDGFQIQVVQLRGPDGKRWRAVYRMVRNDDQWRIGGVALKEAPSTI